MKRTYLLQKTIALLLFAAGSILVGTDAYAQRESITNDREAGSTLDVVNTGTDALYYTAEDRIMQVTVNDGDRPRLFWDYGGTIGEILLATDVQDPDVVVQVYDGHIYALVVFINGNKEVGWESYEWDGSNLFILFEDGVLGHSEYLPEYLGCSNPNVDVNNSGRVAVTWAESFTTMQDVSFDVGDGRDSFSGTVPIDRGDVWAAYGFVNGDNSGLTLFTGLSGRNNQLGDKISQFKSYLFEKNIKPDVAIANGDMPTVTYSYLQNYMTNNFATGTYLIAQRETWAASALTHNKPLGYVTVSNDEPPRIASRKSVPNDFEIVMSKRTNVATCGNIPAHITGIIYNYGVYNGYIHGVSSQIEVNPDLSGTDNYEPVVTYDAGNGSSGDFIVTWTTRSNCPPVADNGLNVISRTMTHPTSTTVNYKYDNYSFVNKGNLNMPEQDTRGDQQIPSVAGVYLNDGSVYFFNDVAGGNVLYKYSMKLDGRENLRTSANVTVTSFPNPFQKQASFKVDVPDNDLAQELVIYDIKGTILDRIKLKEESGEQEITWKPKNKLLTGMYFARIVTLKQTQTIKLINAN